jgi:hypothetical protein
MKKTLTVALVALTTLALPLSDVHAARIPIIYQSGEDVFVAGDGTLPEEFAREKALDGYQAGYMCSVFGILWAYFTVSECKAVAFKGDEYINEPELVTAISAKHPEDSMQMGFWQKHGRYPLGLMIAGLLGAFIWSKVSGSDDDDE